MQRKNLFILLFLIFGISSIFALNPIHDARYQFGPEVFHKDEGKVGMGGISRFNRDLSIPFNLQFGLSDRMEFGARVNINTFEYLKSIQSTFDLGMQFRWTSYEILQIDLQSGINQSGQQGMAVGYTTVRKYTKLLYAYYEIRTAFFDGLTGNDFMAIELGAHPRARVTKNLLLQFGFILSSGIPHLNNTFGLDLQPGFIILFGKHTELHTELTLGVATPGSEKQRLDIWISNDI